MKTDHALSPAGLACFLALADWLACCAGEDVFRMVEVPKLRGMLPLLKRAGLVSTRELSDFSMSGRSTYIRLTPMGRALAAAYGIDVLEPPED